MHIPRLLASGIILLLVHVARADEITYTLTFTAPIVKVGSAPYVYDFYYDQFVTVNGYGDTNGSYTDQYGRLINPLSELTIQVGSLPLMTAASTQIVRNIYGDTYFLAPSDPAEFATEVGSFPGYDLGAHTATSSTFSPVGINFFLTDGSYFGTVCTHYVVTIPPSAKCVDPTFTATFSATLTPAASAVPEPSSFLLLGTGLLAFTRTLGKRRP